MSILTVVTALAILVVALLHAYFPVLKMFLWTKPIGRHVFGLTPEFAEASKTLAANQGLYNGFLAAGLVWAAIAGLMNSAGHFGVQAIPALIALTLAFSASA